MSLSHEHVGLKILAKIKIYILNGAKLLITVWDEIPCRWGSDACQVPCTLGDENDNVNCGQGFRCEKTIWHMGTDREHIGPG